MRFTDDEILLLLDLDFEVDVEVPTRWTRLRSALWWATVTVGSVAAMYLVLQADYSFHTTRLG
jgi:hypothetical protein